MTDLSLDRDSFLVDGQWRNPATSSKIRVLSPHTEAVVATVPAGSPPDIDAAVAAARRAFDFGPWPRTSPADRIAVVERFAAIYATRLEDMAQTISIEMGSPISFSRLAQAPAPWMQIEAFINIARDFPWEESRDGALGQVVVRHEPMGVVAAIPPWNVPQFTIISKVVPAILAGCTVVLKPSPEAPLDSYLMGEMLQEAGLPAGVVNIVPAGREVGEYLVRHRGIDKVAFTGSTVAGRAIASICGQDLKRFSLELGGKSAAIILDDADLDATIEGLKFTSLMNSGQACVAQTRILASRRNHDRVLEALTEGVSALTVGDPLDDRTDIGPMVSQRQRDRVLEYVAVGIKEGARAILGGAGCPEGQTKGWYVKPTIFADVDNRMRIAQEEIFGPVLSVIAYDDIPHAVRIANDSDYGLAGTVWTSDIDAGMDVARQVRTGTYGVNTYTMDFAAPFGGYKKSGIGREFGPEGLSQFTELKSIYRPQ